METTVIGMPHAKAIYRQNRFPPRDRSDSGVKHLKKHVKVNNLWLHDALQ